MLEISCTGSYLIASRRSSYFKSDCSYINISFLNYFFYIIQYRVLRISYTSNFSHMTRIFVAAYHVLYAYLMGNSRKNELYIAKYIDFFLTQFEIKEVRGFVQRHSVKPVLNGNSKKRPKLVFKTD